MAKSNYNFKDINGKQRVIIENVKPEINCGQYPVKRVVGEKITVTADVFTDGHDAVKAILLWRLAGKKRWTEVSMNFIGNDRWQAFFIPDQQGKYEYTLIGWVDHFASWQHGLKRKFEANQDISVELQIGKELLSQAASAGSQNKPKLETVVATLEKANPQEAVKMATSQEISQLMFNGVTKQNFVQYSKILTLEVERKKALFSSWYELFPRSTSEKPNGHGTFKDCEKLLPMIAEMGFDVLYFPPIHPIGKVNRKGKNNSTTAQEEDPGVPWAIGSSEGGHKSIHQELGTVKDFEKLVKKAKNLGIEIALDYALQCAPDHPYVKEHPQWFKWRPDGSVQYAENPPKKYQDVLPFNFETEDWENLWIELKSIVEYWVERGVNIFRVDNPHTKPFTFWEWMIKEVRKKYPETIFLAEAFTKPRVMERLAKLGFQQSYTYFTWRTSKHEITEYVTELTQTDLREYFRPNFWPNTPDILNDHLQKGGEPAFIKSLVMAATLSSNYGIYGPVFDFGINTPVAEGKEEYLNSEKYEIGHWEWSKQTRIREIITLINKIRRENEALQTTWNVQFCDTDNQNLLCYIKSTDGFDNKIIVVVNLAYTQTLVGYVKIPLWKLNMPYDTPYQVHDLLTDEKYTWNNEWNFVELNPFKLPVHVFRIEEESV